MHDCGTTQVHQWIDILFLTFDEDDLGAEVGKQHAAKGPWPDAGNLNNPDARENTPGHGTASQFILMSAMMESQRKGLQSADGSLLRTLARRLD